MGFHADRSPRTPMELLADEAPCRFAVRRRNSVPMAMLVDGGFVQMMLRADEAVRR